MNRFLSVLFLLAAQFVAAADIVVTPPSGVIQPNEYVILSVTGVSDAELPGAAATVEPSDGVQLLAARTWGGKPIIFFKAAKPGKYAVFVSINAFRQKLDEGFAATEQAAIEPPELLSELRIAVTKIGDKYEAKSGSVLLEVAGSVPPPPPGPDPPDIPPVTTGLVWTVVIRTVDTMTADQSEALSNLREWTDQQPFDKVAHYEFSPTAVGPDGSIDKRVATWVAKVPATAKQPYVFVAAKDAAGKSAIIWQGELTKAADVIAKIQEHTK